MLQILCGSKKQKKNFREALLLKNHNKPKSLERKIREIDWAELSYLFIQMGGPFTFFLKLRIKFIICFTISDLSCQNRSTK